MSHVAAGEDTIQEVWYQITEWYSGETRHAPTQREIAELTGKSVTTVWYCLQILRARGVIDFKDNSPRTVSLQRAHPRYRRGPEK